jgi:hypothetical protein
MEQNVTPYEKGRVWSLGDQDFTHLSWCMRNSS